MKKRVVFPVLVFVLAIVFQSCVSTKPKKVSSGKITIDNLLIPLPRNNYEGINGNGIEITTTKFVISSDLIIYSQKYKELKKNGRRLTLYLEDYGLSDAGFRIIGYVLNYSTGKNEYNRTYTTIQWINCPVVCADKRLKIFIQNYE